MSKLSKLEKVFLHEVLRPAIGRHFGIRCQVLVSDLTSVRSRLVTDFVVERGSQTMCVFEIDGHRSHYRNPVQINRDARKNRLLRAERIPVYRLTAGLLEPAAIRATRKFIRRLVWRTYQA